MTALANNESLNAQASEDNAHAATSDPVSLPELVSPAQIDKVLGYKIGKAKRLANRGELPHYKLPDGSIRFSITEIGEVIAACKQGSTPDPRSDFDSYLSAADIAERLNVGVANVEKWAKDDIIPAVRITDRLMRFNWLDVEKALAERTGFNAQRPHTTTVVLTQRQACERLKIPLAALRKLAESGNVPSYKNGDGPGPKFYFDLDILCVALSKLSKETPFQEFLRLLHPPKNRKGSKS